MTTLSHIYNKKHAFCQILWLSAQKERVSFMVVFLQLTSWKVFELWTQDIYVTRHPGLNLNSENFSNASKLFLHFRNITHLDIQKHRCLQYILHDTDTFLLVLSTPHCCCNDTSELKRKDNCWINPPLNWSMKFKSNRQHTFVVCVHRVWHAFSIDWYQRRYFSSRDCFGEVGQVMRRFRTKAIVEFHTHQRHTRTLVLDSNVKSTPERNKCCSRDPRNSYFSYVKISLINCCDAKSQCLSIIRCFSFLAVHGN